MILKSILLNKMYNKSQGKWILREL